jgi:hypothetical protein
MVDWTVCHQCALKHRQRSDHKCPRCGASLGGRPGVAERGVNVAEPSGAAAVSVAPDLDAPPPLPAGVGDAEAALPGDRPQEPTAEEWSRTRAAGALLLANAALIALYVLTRPSWLFGWPARLLIVVDLLLGSLLFIANTWIIRAAKVRCLLTALEVVLLFASGRQYEAAVAGLFCLSLAGLLFGWMRARNALVAGGLSFLLTLALYRLSRPMRDDIPPLDKSRLADIEPAEVGLARGRAFPYVIRFTRPGWRRRTDAVTKRDNRLADQWLVHAQRNAHVVVIAEETPDPVTIGQFADSLMRGLQHQDGTRVQFLGGGTRRQDGALMHTRETCLKCAVPEEIEIYYGLYVRTPYLIQVITYASPETFAEMSGEFLEIIESLSLS